MICTKLQVIAFFANSVIGVVVRTIPSSTVPSTTAIVPTRPPIPTANVPALPSQFFDIPQNIIQCWDDRASYSSASWFLYTELLSSETRVWKPWSTTALSLSPYVNERYSCKTSAIPSLTTLCDGLPRASTYSSSCQTVTGTYTWTVTGEASYYTPAWWTELEQLPSPTCAIATDFGPECSRLKDAYEWRTAQLELQTPAPTGSIAGPGCSVISTAAASAKPTCVLEGGDWEAYYWPHPMPTGTSFCTTNGTYAVSTPTIPGQASTAVISGLTLISPSVYHFMHNVTLKTFAGRASRVGESSDERDLYSASTVAAFLTVAQREDEILTVSRLCAGSNKHRYCTFDASTGFNIADLATVRASEYCGKWGCGSSETIYQDKYKPTLGIPVSQIVSQNGVFADCAWTTTGERVKTKGPAVYSVGAVTGQDWHGITLDAGLRDGTSQGLKTADSSTIV